MIIGLVLTPLFIRLLFAFEVIKISYPTDMADQPSVLEQGAPRLFPPEEAVSFQGLPLIPEEFPANPVPAGAVSLQRGSSRTESTVYCATVWRGTGTAPGRLLRPDPAEPHQPANHGRVRWLSLPDDREWFR